MGAYIIGIYDTILMGQPNTFANRLHCLMSNNSIAVKFLNENKIVTSRPEIRTYQQIQIRVRALKGFSEFPKLHEAIWEEMGRRGMAALTFPIPNDILLDANILNADAFAGAEKKAIPLYREGTAGKVLQIAMCEVA